MLESVLQMRTSEPLVHCLHHPFSTDFNLHRSRHILVKDLATQIIPQTFGTPIDPCILIHYFYLFILIRLSLCLPHWFLVSSPSLYLTTTVARANMSVFCTFLFCACKSTEYNLNIGSLYCRCYFEGASCKYRPKGERRRGVGVRNVLFRDTRVFREHGVFRTEKKSERP